MDTAPSSPSQLTSSPTLTPRLPNLPLDVLSNIADIYLTLHSASKKTRRIRALAGHLGEGFPLSDKDASNQLGKTLEIYPLLTVDRTITSICIRTIYRRIDFSNQASWMAFLEHVPGSSFDRVGKLRFLYSHVYQSDEEVDQERELAKAATARWETFRAALEDVADKESIKIVVTGSGTIPCSAGLLFGVTSIKLKCGATFPTVQPPSPQPIHGTRYRHYLDPKTLYPVRALKEIRISDPQVLTSLWNNVLRVPHSESIGQKIRYVHPGPPPVVDGADEARKHRERQAWLRNLAIVGDYLKLCAVKSKRGVKVAVKGMPHALCLRENSIGAQSAPGSGNWRVEPMRQCGDEVCRAVLSPIEILVRETWAPIFLRTRDRSALAHQQVHHQVDQHHQAYQHETENFMDMTFEAGSVVDPTLGAMFGDHDDDGEYEAVEGVGGW